MAPNFRLKLILTIIRYYTTYHLFKYGSKGIMWDSNFFSLHSHPQLQLQKFRNLAWPQILLELIRAWNPAHSKGGLSIWGRRSSIRWRANSKITSISLCGYFFSYFLCNFFSWDLGEWVHILWWYWAWLRLAWVALSVVCRSIYSASVHSSS